MSEVVWGTVEYNKTESFIDFFVFLLDIKKHKIPIDIHEKKISKKNYGILNLNSFKLYRKS